MLRKLFIRKILGYGLLLLLFPFCAGAATAVQKVNFAHATLSPRLAPLWVAQEQGIFAKYGIGAEVVLVRNAPALIAGIASGDIQMASTGAGTALGAAASGADIAILANFTSRSPMELVARPAIKNAADLKGKRFGIQSFGGTLWLYTMMAFEHLGLEPARDKIQLQAIGDNSVLARALETGTIDAATLSSAAYTRPLRDKGFSILANLKLPIAGLTIIVRKAFARQAPELIDGLLRAQIEGVAFAMSPRNKAVVLDTMRRRLRITNPTGLEESYLEMLSEVDRKPYPSVEGLANIQRFMKTMNPKLAELKIDDVADRSWVRRLDESGFIDRAYAAQGVK
jgi:ABC-type nitrate/sulfonate/bicarbonate transport system substrate-binding protein